MNHLYNHLLLLSAIFIGVLVLKETGLSALPYAQIHRKNQAIMASVMSQELEKLDDLLEADKVHELSKRIGEIAQKAMDAGFDTSAYHYQIMSEKNYLSFSRFSLWEGKDSVPLSLFMYGRLKL